MWRFTGVCGERFVWGQESASCSQGVWAVARDSAEEAAVRGAATRLDTSHYEENLFGVADERIRNGTSKRAPNRVYRNGRSHGCGPLIVKKDFWVCLCLGRLFEMPDLPGHSFKGGTSYSKVYGLIYRFSGDIDISLNRAEMSFGKDNDPAAEDLSGEKRQKLRNELAGACATYI